MTIECSYSNPGFVTMTNIGDSGTATMSYAVVENSSFPLSTSYFKTFRVGTETTADRQFAYASSTCEVDMSEDLIPFFGLSMIVAWCVLFVTVYWVLKSFMK